MNDTVMYPLIGFLIGWSVAQFLRVYRRNKKQRKYRQMATPVDDPRDTTGKFNRIFWRP